MDMNVIDIFNQKLNNLAFTNIFICTNAAKTAKTVVFPSSYNLDSNIGFKVVFVNGHDCGTATYNFTLNGKPIKMNNNGTYQNLPVVQSGTTYYSIQAGTILDLYYDANQSAFIVIGNPVVMSNSTEKVLADGTKLWDFTKGKISSDLGLTSTNYGGKAADATKADSAAKLTTARKTYVTLGTASITTTRDWSGDTTIPVDGTLPVANGGTGQTNLDNVTVGNAKKLGNVTVRTTSIGGGTSETGAHWSYVTKAKFTTTSGYIVYSNGLIIQWFVTKVNLGVVETITLPTTFASTNYAIAACVGDADGGHRMIRWVSRAKGTLQIETMATDVSGSHGTHYSLMVIGY